MGQKRHPAKTSPEERELETFVKVMAAAWAVSPKPWEDRRHDGLALRIHGHVSASHTAITEDKQLLALLPTRGRLAVPMPSSPHVYLSLVTKGMFLPVLTWQCDFGRAHPEVRLNLALYMLDGDGTLRALGFRFETPEEGVEGKHNFYHVQFIRCFLNGRPLHGGAVSCPPWMPITQPALPLAATNSVELLLSVLVSLYGIRSLQELASSPYLDGVELKPYLVRMRLVEP